MRGAGGSDMFPPSDQANNDARRHRSRKKADEHAHVCLQVTRDVEHPACALQL